ncbi:hypothetical protein MASSI9I_10191 [Massilia sp. 9I]|nr:hypothetical protein MASSI9I_10191 [Massilia sp. 9I]
MHGSGAFQRQNRQTISRLIVCALVSISFVILSMLDGMPHLYEHRIDFKATQHTKQQSPWRQFDESSNDWHASAASDPLRPRSRRSGRPPCRTRRAGPGKHASTGNAGQRFPAHRHR